MRSLILIFLVTLLNGGLLDKITFSNNNLSATSEQRWGDIKDDLSDLSTLYNKKVKAPQDRWFGTDKDDIQEDIDKKLNDIIDTLLDNNFKEKKEEIEKLNSKIKKLQLKLLKYQENSISAPTSSTFLTTKDEYKQKIKDTKDEINILKTQVEKIKVSIKDDFSKIAGVNLTNEQMDALLSTVYGDDIIQSSYLISVIKNITKQILELMKMSNENLIKAKRYYGMHLGTVELIYLIQKKYIQKIDNIYLPKIDKIINDTNILIEQTKAKIDQNNQALSKAYQENLKNQELNLKVALLYKEQLLKYKKQIELSLNETKKNLDLAKNTYETVSISNSLYSLIDKSKNEFEKILQLQIPQIEPFKNIQMAQKFKELTNKMLKE